MPIKFGTHDSCGWVGDSRMKVLGMLVETLELNSNGADQSGKAKALFDP